MPDLRGERSVMHYKRRASHKAASSKAQEEYWSSASRAAESGATLTAIFLFISVMLVIHILTTCNI